MERSKLLELSSKHFACVYKLVFPDGKVYVGKSKDIGKRVGVYKLKCDGSWADGHNSPVDLAIREFGIEKVEIEIIFSVNYVCGVDRERDLDYALGIVEMRWIKECRSSESEYGYNGHDGGEMFGIRRMEKIKEVEKPRVVYKDVLVERRHQTLGVPVVGYDINGNYIGEWESRVAFTREVINAKGTLGFGQWRKGFIMYPKEEPVAQHVESYAEYIERTRAAEIEAKKVLESKVGRLKVLRDVRYTRGVVITDYNFEEVGRYDNIRDAAEETGLRYSGIYTCLKNGYGSVGGYHAFWSDEWDDDKESCIKKITLKHVKASIDKTNYYECPVEKTRKNKFGKIYQYDVNFNEIGVYNSIAIAANETGNSSSCIYSAAKRGGNAFAGGCHWRFEADRIPPKEENIETGIDEGQQTVLSDDEF